MVILPFDVTTYPCIVHAKDASQLVKTPAELEAFVAANGPIRHSPYHWTSEAELTYPSILQYPWDFVKKAAETIVETAVPAVAEAVVDAIVKKTRKGKE